MGRQFKKNTRNDVLSLHEEKKRVLEQVGQLDFFEEKRHRAMLLYRLDGHLRNEGMAIQAEELLYELLDNQYKATTFFAQIACFNGLTLLYRLKQENKTTIYHFQEILKLWGKPEYEHFRKAYQDLYKLDVYKYF